MAELFVKPGNCVEHDGVRFGDNEKAGAKLPQMTEAQAKALLVAGVAQASDPQNGVSSIEVPESAPTEAEIAQAAEQAGRKGILNFGK